MTRVLAATLGCSLLLVRAAAFATPPPAPPSERAALARELAGDWTGVVREGTDSCLVALTILPDSTGGLALVLSIPLVHLERVPLGGATWTADGDSLGVGPLRLAFDRSARVLSGWMPAPWTPGHAIPLTLRPATAFAPSPRAPLPGRRVTPAWTADIGGPSWAGPRFADGVLYVGGDDGVVHALDARDGSARWTYRTGGAIRSRPSVSDGAVYVQSDDGTLTRLAASDGRLTWRTKVAVAPLRRLPPGDPGTRFDRFGSDVVIAGPVLYLGTYEGRVLALAAADGHVLWEYRLAGPVLAAPALAGGRLVAAGMDGAVVALDPATGRLQWKRDTGGAIVSIPAIDADRIVIGNRTHDLYGLDAATGAVVWRHYVWMSWVESSAVIRDGVAYVGSGDAARVAAFDTRRGAPRWSCDVQGWAWGQPVVSDRFVYVTTSGRQDAGVPFRAGVLALDRAGGEVVWRYEDPPAAFGDYGFPGSPARGGGFVFASSYDGHVLAFLE